MHDVEGRLSSHLACSSLHICCLSMRGDPDFLKSRPYFIEKIAYLTTRSVRLIRPPLGSNLDDPSLIRSTP